MRLRVSSLKPLSGNGVGGLHGKSGVRVPVRTCIYSLEQEKKNEKKKEKVKKKKKKDVLEYVIPYSSFSSTEGMLILYAVFQAVC